MFDSVMEVELCEGGKDKPIKFDNREEFVRLRIQHEFSVQCKE